MSTQKSKKPTMTREQAAELYQDLQRSMAKMLKNEAEYYKSVDAEPAPKAKGGALPQLRKKGFSLKDAGGNKARVNRGHVFALSTLLFFALAKVTLSALEYSGFASVAPVQATQMPVMPLASQLSGSFTREEVRILTALDSRRAELEERNQRLDEREQDIERRDKEFALRVTQLKELSEKLDTEMDKDQRKKDVQLEQLSNVYGSMNPEEAAKLIEQLDVTIALPLIERMPEKRIGQILAAMTPERALTITKLMSNKANSSQ